MLLTGDRQAAAQRTAAELGMAEVIAEALPQQTMDRVLADIRAGFRPMVPCVRCWSGWRSASRRRSPVLVCLGLVCLGLVCLGLVCLGLVCLAPMRWREIGCSRPG